VCEWLRTMSKGAFTKTEWLCTEKMGGRPNRSCRDATVVTDWGTEASHVRVEKICVGNRNMKYSVSRDPIIWKFSGEHGWV